MVYVVNLEDQMILLVKIYYLASTLTKCPSSNLTSFKEERGRTRSMAVDVS